jgi:hypothetical protein
MAEQFLNRLNQIEDSINQLGETLKRMITILGSVTEIKSDIRVAKEEILQGLSSLPAPAAAAPVDDNTDEFAKMVVQEVGAVRVFVQESVESLKNDMMDILADLSERIDAVASAPPAPAAPATVAPAAAPAPSPEPVAGSPAAETITAAVPADRAMKVADQLDRITKSLKMGCIAGDVLDTMNEVKAEITKIVPSDPIMVKIDKWAGVVAAYPKRHELQARDILKLKKDLKAETPKYRPA